MWTLRNKIYSIKTNSSKFYEVKSESGILNDIDSGPICMYFDAAVV